MIGLPGAGKTTAIEEFLRSIKLPIKYLNIATYKGYNREFRLAQDCNEEQMLIVESACGIQIPNTHVLKLKPPIQLLYKRLQQRDNDFDCDYLSLIDRQMIWAHCTISTGQELILALHKIFGVSH